MRTGATGCWFGGPYRPSWFRAPRLARPPTAKKDEIAFQPTRGMCSWSGNKKIPDASADPHALVPHPGGDGAGRGVLIAAYNVPRTLVAGRKRGSVARAKWRGTRQLFPASFLSNFSTKFHLNSLNFYNFQTNFAQYMSSNFRTSVHQGKGQILLKFSNFSTLFLSNRGGEGGARTRGGF